MLFSRGPYDERCGMHPRQGCGARPKGVPAGFACRDERACARAEQPDGARGADAGAPQARDTVVVTAYRTTKVAKYGATS